MQRVHGFFSLDAFLLGFPFGEWFAHFIFQRVKALTHNAAAFVDLLWQGFKLCNQIFSGVVDVGFGTGNLMRHGCYSVAAFTGRHIRHQAASFFLDSLNDRVELLFGGEYRHCVLFINED